MAGPDHNLQPYCARRLFYTRHCTHVLFRVRQFGANEKRIKARFTWPISFDQTHVNSYKVICILHKKRG